MGGCTIDYIFEFYEHYPDLFIKLFINAEIGWFQTLLMRTIRRKKMVEGYIRPYFELYKTAIEIQNLLED